MTIKPSKALIVSSQAPDTQLSGCFAPPKPGKENSKHLMSVGHDGDIHVWANPSGKHLVSVAAHSGPIFHCVWSEFNNCSLAATCSHDATTIIWDFSDPLKPKIARQLYGHSDCVRSCAFDCTGEKIVTGSYDKTAKVRTRKPQS